MVGNGNAKATLKGGSTFPSVPSPGKTVAQAVVSEKPDEDGFYNGYLYVPEVGNIADYADYSTTTSLIIEGDYASPTNPGKIYHRFYRLDFIRVDSQEEDGVQNFTVLNAIERNHRYIFSIDYLAPTAGRSSLAEALANDPENIINDSKTYLAVVNQEEIKSITTDQFVYLGVTSDEIYASEAESSTGYYWARFYVITNNSQGWRLDDLPEGVSTTVSSWAGDSEEQIPVVVWIDKNYYKSGDTLTLLIFSSRIRKSIDIHIP